MATSVANQARGELRRRHVLLRLVTDVVEPELHHYDLGLVGQHGGLDTRQPLGGAERLSPTREWRGGSDRREPAVPEGVVEEPPAVEEEVPVIVDEA